MPPAASELSLPVRSPSWKWWICGLLLLATMINYMDRLTLNLTAERIMEEFRLDEPKYAQLESAFALAFALGAIVFGWMADRWNVRWLYPAAIFAWSVAGFVTGLALTFEALLLCRFLLGLAEAGNWPCALRTTQRILPASKRPLGNGILQSGAAIGAIVTPWIVLQLVTRTGSWRPPFLVIGLAGMAWMIFWFLMVRSADLALRGKTTPASLVRILGWLIVLFSVDTAVHMVDTGIPGLPLLVKASASILGILGIFLWLRSVTQDDTALPRRVFYRRYWVLVVVVVTINMTWHYFRAWLPLFLQRQHGYSEAAMSHFMTGYYIATDLGSLAAGFATIGLIHRGLGVHRSRVLVFAVCAAITTLSVVAALLPPGPLLLGVLLLIGFAALGLFPNYYSLNQEITFRHQGKVTGATGCTCWLAMALLHEVVGDSIKATGSYSLAMAVAGLIPLIGVLALVFFWGNEAPPQELPTPASDLVEDHLLPAAANKIISA